MKVKVLASGSKGNCTYVETNNLKLLIDLGINFITIKSRLEEINILPTEINAILITHNHSDHIKGLASYIKKTNCNVYVPHEISEQLTSLIPIENICILDNVTEFKEDIIQLIPTSHDAKGSVGYKITSLDSTLVYITDTGYINERNLKNLENADVYFMESNHDEQMLMEGPYPHYLKQRVLSDMGHLSNTMASKYLSKLIGNKTKTIILGHLSEQNNTEILAYEALISELTRLGVEKEILIAKQHVSLEVIEV